MKETEYLMASKEIKRTLRELQEHPFTGTGKNKFLITEKDFLLANRKASKEEEIAQHGKQTFNMSYKNR